MSSSVMPALSEAGTEGNCATSATTCGTRIGGGDALGVLALAGCGVVAAGNPAVA